MPDLDNVRVISLTQPWATLLAKGVKRIETRSWKSYYEGVLLIHASKRFPKYERELCDRRVYMEGLDYMEADHLPTGAIVGGCWMYDCRMTNALLKEGLVTEQEEEFGDFSSARWGWLTRWDTELTIPVPAKGSLGLWTLNWQALRESDRAALKDLVARIREREHAQV